VSTIQGTVASEARLTWLSDRLVDDGAVTIADAAGALGVSEMTIRRDLAELEERGTARRVRGGAKAIGPQTFARRHSTAARAKSRIAAKLATIVSSTGLIAFDASSTVMRLSSRLDTARDVTIVTNGPDTFAALQGQPGVTPLLTGGQLDPRTGSLVGALACRAAQQFAVDVFVTSAAAVHAASGASEATLDESEIKRTIAASAGKVVLAVDSSKLDQRAAATALDWDAIDLLVTELDPHDDRLAAYRELAEVR
jgi:DeoR family fructose operon transcriptional repressor